MCLYMPYTSELTFCSYQEVGRGLRKLHIINKHSSLCWNYILFAPNFKISVQCPSLYIGILVQSPTLFQQLRYRITYSIYKIEIGIPSRTSVFISSALFYRQIKISNIPSKYFMSYSKSLSYAQTTMVLVYYVIRSDAPSTERVFFMSFRGAVKVTQGG